MKTTKKLFVKHEINQRPWFPYHTDVHMYCMKIISSCNFIVSIPCLCAKCIISKPCKSALSLFGNHEFSLLQLYAQMVCAVETMSFRELNCMRTWYAQSTYSTTPASLPPSVGYLLRA